MAMVVKNNMSAVSTLNTLNKNQSLLSKSLAQVSSGMKINSAQDDASGYAISERMRVMIRSLDQANANTQDGSSLMKVAEGAVSKTVDILRSLREKSIAAATDTKTDEDRATIQKEINQLVDQIDDNALVTFNGKYLIDGSKTASGSSTYSTWTNQALAEDTTALTKLTDLQARNGESLIIEATDKVTVSYVQNGKTYTTTKSVGNQTLNDIFKLAEEIDTTTTTFAISSNEAVQAAGGVDQLATDKDTIQAAIDKLRDQLSYRNQDGFLKLGIDADGDGKILNVEDDPSTAATDETSAEEFGQEGGVNNTYIRISGTGSVAQIVSADSGTTTSSLAGATLEPLTGNYTLGMKSTYNGELTEKVTSALGEYKTASSSAASYKTAFVEALSTYNQSVGEENKYYWSETDNSIDDAKNIATKTGNENVINAYNNFKNALDKQSAAYTALDSRVKEYNEGLAQLDTLLALKDLENAKSAYLKKVDAYINEVEEQMGNAAAGATFTLPAGVAGNNKILEYKSGTTSQDVIYEITSYLRDKLEGLVNNLSLIGETGTALADAVNAVIGGGKEDNGTTDVVASGNIFHAGSDGTYYFVGTPSDVYGTLDSDAPTKADKKNYADAKTTAFTTAAGTDGVEESVLNDLLAVIEKANSADESWTVDATMGAFTELANLDADARAALTTDADKEIFDIVKAAAETVRAAALAADDTDNDASDDADPVVEALMIAVNALNTASKTYYAKVNAVDPAESTATGAQLVDTRAAYGLASTDYNEKLKLVYDDALEELSGPALLIGSQVGLDPAGKVVSTLDGTVGLTFMAANAGTNGQISGFTISISDSDGNVRKSVNTSLNAWSTTIYAKNASTKDNSLTFQIGASANQSITVDMADMRAEALGLKGKDGKVVDVVTKDHANAAISVFETALQKALDVQTTIGAIEARLTYTSDNLTTASENVQASESTIRDADMAKAMTEYTKNNVLLQAAQSMLAQANQNSSAVLSLLQ